MMRRAKAGFPIVLVGLLVLPGCSEVEPDAPEAHSFTLRDSAGVEIAESGSTGAWGEGVFQVREVVRIGEVTGPEELQLYRVGAVARGAGDTIFAAFSDPPEIRAFTPEGEYIRTIGREGDGPGEFRQTGDMRLWADTVFVGYSGNGRATWYRTDGTLIKEVPTRSGGQTLWVQGRADEGYMVLLDGATPRPPTEIGQWQEARSRYAWIASLESASARLDGGETWPPEVVETNSVVTNRAMAVATQYGRETVRPIWAQPVRTGFDDSGRQYVTSPDELKVSVFDRRGTLVRRFSRQFDPTPITEDLMERVRARARTEAPADPRGAAPLEQRLQSIDLPGPATVPAIRRMLVSNEGAVWLQRYDVTEDPLDLLFPPTTTLTVLGQRVDVPDPSLAPWLWWDVFGTDGRFLGTVELPPRFTPKGVGRDWVLGVERDELDVEYIAWYTVEGVGG